MKKFMFVLALVLAGFSVAHADDLITYSVYPGFVTPPDTPKQWLSIQDDGQVVMHMRDAKVQRRSDTVLATLSQEALAKVKDTIKNTDEKIEIHDKTPKTPSCPEASSAAVVMHKDSKEVKIYAASGCHEFVVNEYPVSELANLAIAFYSLAQ